VETERADFTTHPEHPELGCTPDYYIGADTVLEIKWCGQHAAQNFGDEGTDDVPAHYLCQVNWQCFITGRSKWVLYVLGPWGFRKYEGKHNQEFTRRLSFAALKFWGEYIVNPTPPPLSGHGPDSAYVNAKAPLDDGSIVQASDDIEVEVAALGNELQTLAELELSIEGRKNRIKDFMGEASILRTASGNFTWKKSKDRETTDWKAIAEPIASEEEIAAHTTTKEGARVFRTPFSTQKA
jgi:predicted phage-related endonuclease